MSSLQTARTLPKGDTDLGAAVAAQGTLFEGPVVIPHFEIFGRRGLAENFDIGLKLSSAGGINIDGKYQFNGDQNSKSAKAVGAGLAFWYDGYKYVTSYQTLALYLSFHPNENFAWYAVPKIFHQLEFGIGNKFKNGISNENTFFGGNFGFQKRIKPKISIIGEASTFVPLNGGFFFQADVGIIFHFKK